MAVFPLAFIKNIHKDRTHKTTTMMTKNHEVIYVEDLQIPNMTASAKGTIEAPGTNVKAKSGLNRAILHQSWGELQRQLTYKQEWRGGQVIFVPPHNTSRRCSSCGYTDAENRKSQAKFCCLKCGYLDNADLNAAKNILAVGHTVRACGVITQSTA